MPLPRSRTKLLKLFSQIQDESIRKIISEVVGLENENRSSRHFPVNRIENIIDNEASLSEFNNQQDMQK